MEYSLNDIFVVPASVSDIDSRVQCNPYYENGRLPLFTAPMGSVVGLNNYKMFEKNNITPIISRTENLESRLSLCSLGYWCAFGLDEFEENFVKNPITGDFENIKLNVLIDIANGNMRKLHDAIRRAKKTHGDSLMIMAGNIANSETYHLLAEAGADYVRVGIGTGSVCITSSNTGIHYPMASLIKECFEISLHLEKPAYIVADGGIKGYSDIIKCLALGADYVMCGSLFNRMLESAGVTRVKSTLLNRFANKNFCINSVVDQYDPDVVALFKTNGIDLYKEHYGMSTKKAQIYLGADRLKTSEGIEKTQPVEYTMDKWVDNFSDYLKSAMSYTSARELADFIGEVQTVIVSNNSYNSVNR